MVVKETTCRSLAGVIPPQEDLLLEQDARERLWQQGFAATLLRKQKEVWKDKDNNSALSSSRTEPWLRPC